MIFSGFFLIVEIGGMAGQFRARHFGLVLMLWLITVFGSLVIVIVVLFERRIENVCVVILSFKFGCKDADCEEIFDMV